LRRGRTVASLSAVPTLDIGVLFQQSVSGTGTSTGSVGTANSGMRSRLSSQLLPSARQREAKAAGAGPFDTVC